MKKCNMIRNNFRSHNAFLQIGKCSILKLYRNGISLKVFTALKHFLISVDSASVKLICSKRMKEERLNEITALSESYILFVIPYNCLGKLLWTYICKYQLNKF